MNKRWIWNGFKYLLAIGLLTYVVWSNWSPTSKTGKPLPGLKAVWDAHVLNRQPIHGDCLALAATLCLAAILLTFVRWYYLVRAQGLPFTMTNALRLGMVAFYFNIFLPGAVGGDIIKAAFIARGQSRRTVAVATVILDRVIALWGLFWFVALLGTFLLALRCARRRSGRAFANHRRNRGRRRGPEPAVLSGPGPPAGAACRAFRGSSQPHPQSRTLCRRVLACGMDVPSPAEECSARPAAFRRGACRLCVDVLLLRAHAFGRGSDTSVTRSFPDRARRHDCSSRAALPGSAGIAEWAFGWLYQMLHYPERNGILGSLVQRVIYWVLGLVLTWSICA